MEIKKYRVKVTPKHSEIRSDLHEGINGSIAVPIDFVVGNRGYFVYEVPDDFFTKWHRICTSIVLSINENTVETENTYYIFEEI